MDRDQKDLEEAIDNGLLQMPLVDFLFILAAALLFLGVLVFGIPYLL